jgi:uncharacterized membrane protein YidH (DUF202 family)
VKILGVLLIILGVVGLVYGGFSYTSHKKAIDIGPIQVMQTERHSVAIPRALGVLAILGGGTLLYLGAREGR